MRQRWILMTVGGVALAAAGLVRQGMSAAVDRPIPVVAELYTSEGCSDCPPADRLLSSLAGEPVPGVEIIALGEHVDYWNYLGWTDRFSKPAFTARQKAYQAAVFAPTPVYTPQLVIDGRLEAVGSDRNAVLRAVGEAARSPRAEVRIRPARDRRGQLTAGIELALPAALERRGAADVLIAVTEDGLATDVARGENEGRRLEHDAVVRRLERVGEIAANAASASLAVPVQIDPDWQPSRLKLVVLVQERATRRIIGAAQAPLPPGG